MSHLSPATDTLLFPRGFKATVLYIQQSPIILTSHINCELMARWVSSHLNFRHVPISQLRTGHQWPISPLINLCLRSTRATNQLCLTTARVASSPDNASGTDPASNTCVRPPCKRPIGHCCRYYYSGNRRRCYLNYYSAYNPLHSHATDPRLS